MYVYLKITPGTICTPPFYCLKAYLTEGFFNLFTIDPIKNNS